MYNLPNDMEASNRNYIMAKKAVPCKAVQQINQKKSKIPQQITVHWNSSTTRQWHYCSKTNNI